MPVASRMLAPADGLTIRQPTDGSLEKGNIRNPPRFQPMDIALGGLQGAGSEGLAHGAYSQKPPGETQRKMPNIKGSRD